MYRSTLSLICLSMLLNCSGGGEETVETDATKEISSEDLSGSTPYSLDTVNSVVYWSGRETLGSSSHRGTLKLQDGTFYVKNGELVGGRFTMDMTSITVNDLKSGDGKEKLEGHLKSGDFFEVGEHPRGQFEITSLKPDTSEGGATHSVSGNLTLKGISKNITIPARINVNEENVVATSNDFSIDRTEWDIMFRSGLVGTAKDKIIADAIKLRMRVRGMKPSGDSPEKNSDQETE